MKQKHTEDGSVLNLPADVMVGGEEELAGCNHGSEEPLGTKKTVHLVRPDHLAVAANRRNGLSWSEVQILAQAPFGFQVDWEHYCHRTA